MEILYYLGKGLGLLLIIATIATAIIYGTLLLFGLIIYSTRYAIWKLILKRETSDEFLNSIAKEKGYKSYKDMRYQWIEVYNQEFTWSFNGEQRLEPELDEERIWESPKVKKLYNDLHDISRKHDNIYHDTWNKKWYILKDYKFTNNAVWKGEAFTVAGTTFIILLASYTIAGLAYYSEHGHVMPSPF